APAAGRPPAGARGLRGVRVPRVRLRPAGDIGGGAARRAPLSKTGTCACACLWWSMASRLEKRMQVLIDDERFQRLEAEAAAQRTSVAAVVRAAIDEHLASGQVTRAEAARRLLAQFDDGGEPEPDWAESKQELLDDLVR